jgi:hypothetical protein
VHFVEHLSGKLLERGSRLGGPLARSFRQIPAGQKALSPHNAGAISLLTVSTGRALPSACDTSPSTVATPQAVGRELTEQQRPPPALHETSPRQHREVYGARPRAAMLMLHYQFTITAGSELACTQVENPLQQVRIG